MSIAAATKIPCVCDGCAKTIETKATPAGQARIPSGWKRHNGVWCSDCWGQRYVLRAITIPVAEPVGATWAEFRPAIKAMFVAATNAANAAVHALCCADTVRLPAHAKLPKMEMPNVYAAIRAASPEMDSGSAAAMAQAITGKYRARRYETIWLRAASHPVYRYPTPYPIRSQEWRAERGEDGQALVNIRFAGQRWILRLRGGHGFRRQLAVHAQILSGDAIPCEISLYQRSEAKAGDSDNRPSGTNGARRTTTMAKLVAWLPRKSRTDREGVLAVKTDGESFLVAFVGEKSERLWILNADRVKRWLAARSNQRQREREDLKYEKRWPKAVRERMLEDGRHRDKLLRDRLDSFIHEASALVANYAKRQRVAECHYDDTNRTFAPTFPWRMLADRMRYKLDEHGITMTHASGEVVRESAEPLAITQEETQQ